MLKSGTTVEQGEKRIRAWPRVAETFLRGRMKEGGRIKPNLTQPGRNKGVQVCHPHVPRPDPSAAPQDPPRAAAPALPLEPLPRAGTISRTPRGSPPQHPGVSPAPSHTLRSRLPPHGHWGSLSSRPRLSPRRSPPQGLGLPRGRRDRTSHGPRYSPAPLCLPSGPHGQEQPTASARSPQGLGRSECPRLRPRSAVQGQLGQFSRFEHQEPPATDCGRRDINNATDRCAGADTPPPGSGCAGRPQCHILPTLGKFIRYRG